MSCRHSMPSPPHTGWMCCERHLARSTRTAARTRGWQAAGHGQTPGVFWQETSCTVVCAPVHLCDYYPGWRVYTLPPFFPAFFPFYISPSLPLPFYTFTIDTHLILIKVLNLQRIMQTSKLLPCAQSSSVKPLSLTRQTRRLAPGGRRVCVRVQSPEGEWRIVPEDLCLTLRGCALLVVLELWCPVPKTCPVCSATCQCAVHYISVSPSLEQPHAH